MDPNDTKPNINSSLPTPSPQLQPQQQKPFPKYGRGLKMTIWILCSAILGTLPLVAVFIYSQMHDQITTLPGLLIKGDLIAISIAIIGDAFGQTILTIVKKSDEKIWLLINIIVLIASVFGLCIAFFVFSNFIGYANCTEHHPQNTSQYCNLVGISDTNVLLYSIIFYGSCILVGLVVKALED